MNTVLKKTLNYHISLLEACRCLVKMVNTFEVKLLQAKTINMIFRPQILDINEFATILNKVTSYAIDLILPE
jgi:hypothetical protein